MNERSATDANKAQHDCSHNSYKGIAVALVFLIHKPTFNAKMAVSALMFMASIPHYAYETWNELNNMITTLYYKLTTEKIHFAQL